MATENQMDETQKALAFALKMYGEASVTYASSRVPAHFDNLLFWQNQVWQCSIDEANKEQQ